MPINIPLEDETTGLLFTKSYEESAVAQLAEFEQLLSPRDQIVHNFNASGAKFHSPGGADKSAGVDTVTSTRVPVETMYKIMEFHDKQYDDRVAKRIIDRIEAQIPGIMAESLDRVPFGPQAIEDSPAPGFTEAAHTVDETAASWLGAVAALRAKGFRASGFLLDHAYEAPIRIAFTEGSMVNPLTFGVQDGFSIAGIPVRFRDLGEDDAGNPFGVLGQWNQSVLVSYDRFEELEVHLPGQDWALRLKNRIGVYAGWRLGFGVGNQAAFLPLTLGAAVTG